MNKKPERFVAVARAQLGVPFVPQGRASYHALDCIGLPVVSAIATGFDPEFISDYELKNEYHETLISYLEKNGNQVSYEEAQIGDLVAFWIMNQERPRHLAILCDTDNEAESVRFGMIHTSESAKRVIEHDLDFKWRKHIHSIWRLKGMKDYNKDS
tara:strand:+ start:19559 stop:20026 length:468 start_codon:yes stop_codon:yes gene_type:complete